MSLRIQSMSGAAFEEASRKINFNWLLKLRWILITGQLLLIAMTHWWIGITLPLSRLFALIAIAGVSNLALALWVRHDPAIREWMLGALMLLDLVLLTGLFYYTGGPANPFSFLYLVYIAMGIVVLQARWMWFVSFWTLLCYGFLFLRWDNSHRHHAIHDPKQMQLHLEGMWLAYALTTVLIGYFVTRMKRALVEREKELMAMHDLQFRSEKLASLAALAGGAVHEMATPLSTIAVVAKELERALEKHEGTQELVEDACLIREQVELCHHILHELVSQAGENLGEVSHPITLEKLFAETLAQFPAHDRVHTEISESAQTFVASLPPKAFPRVLRNLLKNALEASSSEDTVTMRANIAGDTLQISVTDAGTGIAEDIVHRIGEPFFTTKPAGRGHGLGIFLAQALTERFGGELQLKTELGKGTEVSLLFPLSSFALEKAIEQKDESHTTH